MSSKRRRLSKSSHVSSEDNFVDKSNVLQPAEEKFNQLLKDTQEKLQNKRELVYSQIKKTIQGIRLSSTKLTTDKFVILENIVKDSNALQDNLKAIENFEKSVEMKVQSISNFADVSKHILNCEKEFKKDVMAFSC